MAKDTIQKEQKQAKIVENYPYSQKNLNLTKNSVTSHNVPVSSIIWNTETIQYTVKNCSYFCSDVAVKLFYTLYILEENKFFLVSLFLINR